MGNNRESIGLGDDDLIDLDELNTGSTLPMTSAQEKELVKGGEALGMVSRMPKKRRGRRKSPYTVAKGVKVREGMPDLFIDLAAHLDLLDNQTFEKAVGLLIDVEGTEDLKKRFKKITE
jgi:hypothetical protein